MVETMPGNGDAKREAKAFLDPVNTVAKPTLILGAVASVVALGLVIVAVPPLAKNLGLAPASNTNTAQWLSFAVFALETLTALAIGGTIVGQRFKRLLEDRASVLERALDQTATRTLEALLDQLGRNIAHSFVIALTLPAQPRRAWRDIRTLLENTASIASASRSLPSVVAIFVATRMVVRFPGGLFGLLSYLGLLSLVVVKLLQLFWIEYA